MKVIFKTIEDNNDKMLLIVIEENNEEIEKFPIYVSHIDSEKIPYLKESLELIPKIFEMVYNSGKNNEKIEFVYEDVLI